MTGPRLWTAFDRAVPALEIPGELVRGDDLALQVVDGFTRGLSLPGRFLRSPGLVGIKVDPSGGTSETIRVSLTLGVDEGSVTWWEDRVPTSVQPRTPRSPRLLLVRSQGRTRTAVVVQRGGPDAGRATATFDLPVKELDGDSLLVLEVLDVGRELPPWAGDVVVPQAAIGVRIDRVAVADGTDAGSADGRDPLTPLPNGLFIADPATDGAPPRWVLRPVMTNPPPPAPPTTPGAAVIPRAPSAAAPVRAGRPLPPPPPGSRFGRWRVRMRTRMEAESRLGEPSGRPGSAATRSQSPATTTAALPAGSQRRQATGVRRAAVDGEAMLVDLVADLVREHALRIRAAGLAGTGPSPMLTVSRGDGADIVVTGDRPVTETSLVRLDVIEDEVLAAPELQQYGVVWHRVDAAG